MKISVKTGVFKISCIVAVVFFLLGSGVTWYICRTYIYNNRVTDSEVRTIATELYTVTNQFRELSEQFQSYIARTTADHKQLEESVRIRQENYSRLKAEYQQLKRNYEAILGQSEQFRKLNQEFGKLNQEVRKQNKIP